MFDATLTRFPVLRVGKKPASRAVRIPPPPPNFILYKLECTGGGASKKKIKILKHEKKIPLAAYRPSRAVHRKRFFI